MLQDDWYRCYGKSWKGAIVDEAFSHPAKFSKGLIRAIYDHAIAEGWLKAGDRVLDCFGGVALGALDAMRLGLHWTGIELEQKFCDLGHGCQCTGISREDWIRFYGRWHSANYRDGHHWCPQCLAEANRIEEHPVPLRLDLFDICSASYQRNSGKIPSTEPHHYVGNVESWRKLRLPGTATLLQGDSRRLGEVVRESVQAAVSSPPYMRSLEHRGGIDPNLSQYVGGPHSQMNNSRDTRYGESDGQLGAMGAGDFEACVSSPPYEAGCRHTGGDDKHPEHIEGGEYVALGYDACVSSPPFENAVGSDDPDKRGGLFRDPERRGDVNLTGTYGESEGQLGAMAGGFDAAVSSPPYEATRIVDSKTMSGEIASIPEHIDSYGEGSTRRTVGSIDTFWSSARTIIEQAYSLLVPGGVAIWVCKDFIRKGERVKFSQQWAALNEACGFEWLHEHRCWVVEDHGTQLGFFEDDDKIVERKSFFRHLYESKYPENRIDWESVLCMRKPFDRGCQ